MTSEQRLDRLERIAKLFVRAGLRERGNRRELDDKINIIINAQIAYEERFAQNEERFAQNEERFARNEERFARNEERFARNEERFAQIEAQFARTDAQIKALTEAQTRTDERLATLIEIVTNKQNGRNR